MSIVCVRDNQFILYLGRILNTIRHLDIDNVSLHVGHLDCEPLSISIITIVNRILQIVDVQIQFTSHITTVRQYSGQSLGSVSIQLEIVVGLQYAICHRTCTRNIYACSSSNEVFDDICIKVCSSRIAISINCWVCRVSNLQCSIRSNGDRQVDDSTATGSIRYIDINHICRLFNNVGSISRLQDGLLISQLSYERTSDRIAGCHLQPSCLSLNIIQSDGNDTGHVLHLRNIYTIGSIGLGSALHRNVTQVCQCTREVLLSTSVIDYLVFQSHHNFHILSCLIVVSPRNLLAREHSICNVIICHTLGLTGILTHKSTVGKFKLVSVVLGQFVIVDAELVTICPLDDLTSSMSRTSHTRIKILNSDIHSFSAKLCL